MAVWFSLGAEKGGSVIGATLLNMAVFGAMISYAFQGHPEREGYGTTKV